MTADIDAVLSWLRERPECRDAVEVIERLTAERDRLREALWRLAEERVRVRYHLDDDDPSSWVEWAIGESPVAAPSHPTGEERDR